MVGQGLPTLGSEVNTAYIYERGGRKRAFKVEGVNKLSWGRTQNAIAEATIDVSIAAAGPECCGKIGDMRTWAYELVMFRGDDRVWEGPVYNLRIGKTGVSISAWDVLGWLKRRRIHTDRTTTVPHPSVEEMELAIQRGFAPADPNVLAYLDVRAPTFPIDIVRDVRVNSGYYADDLTTLSGQGANFTTVGRSAVVWGDGDPLGVLPEINAEEHLLADVEVIEDGMGLATAATARNDNDQYDTVGGVDPYYSLLDLIVSGNGAADVPSLTAIATAARDLSYPAPVLLSVPADSQVSPKAPLPMSSLVPGVFVPVSSSGTCRPIQQTMVLSGVKVEQDASGEKVSISVRPLSGVVS